MAGESATIGLMSRDQLIAELRCSERTIVRLEHRGMPVIRVGYLRFYDAAKVKDWFLTHQQTDA